MSRAEIERFLTRRLGRDVAPPGGVATSVGWYFPEVGSSITAFFIWNCGVFMLRTWHSGTYVTLIASLLMVNGIFSTLTHTTGLNKFLQIDGKSMMLAAWLAFCFVMVELVRARHTLDLPHTVPRRTPERPRPTAH